MSRFKVGDRVYTRVMDHNGFMVNAYGTVITVKDQWIDVLGYVYRIKFDDEYKYIWFDRPTELNLPERRLKHVPGAPTCNMKGAEELI